MSLVERFVEIGNWPTSRKTVLWTAILLPLHLLMWVGMPLLERVPAAESQLFGHVMGTWTAFVALSLGLALWPALKGRDAPWTGYAFTVLYALPVIAVGYLFDSPEALSFIPVVILFCTVLFDERFGATALLFAIAAGVSSSWLQNFGVLPSAATIHARYAPEAAAFALQGLTILLFQTFVIVVILCTLIVSARRLQERRLAQSSELIRKYVPAQVAQAIFEGRHDGTGRHERRKLTIFFSDIAGFTDLSEELEPEDLSRVLNEYFSEMMAIAHKHHGTVDELSGDAILVFFGAPEATDDKDHARRAVRMAVEMQQAVVALNARLRASGITETLRVRMGINTGVVTVGNFGSPDRMKYAALGKHINLAARIQSQCEPGKVLLSEASWLLVKDEIQCTPRGEMQLKGISKPVAAYEIQPA